MAAINTINWRRFAPQLMLPLAGPKMRDKWYGDNRDLVKWSVLLTLAEKHNAKGILQVLYWRATDWGMIDVDSMSVPLPSAVVHHFRRTGAATAIQARVPIETFDAPFLDRDKYQGAVIERIRSRSGTPGVVFLDPDTGLQPRKPSLNHVLDRELQEIWTTLTPGDILAVYQHQTDRTGQRWIRQKARQFEDALGLRRGQSRLAQGKQIAHDVAFFYALRAD